MLEDLDEVEVELGEVVDRDELDVELDVELGDDVD